MDLNNDGPKCRECDGYTCRIGTFSACANMHCERYAVPVNDQGQTDEEAHADAIKPLFPEEPDCRECAGRGWYAFGPTDKPEQRQCEACLGTGKERQDDDATGCSEKSFAEYLASGPSHNGWGHARND